MAGWYWLGVWRATTIPRCPATRSPAPRAHSCPHASADSSLFSHCRGRRWASLAFQMTYGKYISDSVPMTQWCGRGNSAAAAPDPRSGRARAACLSPVPWSRQPAARRRRRPGAAGRGFCTRTCSASRRRSCCSSSLGSTSTSTGARSCLTKSAAATCLLRRQSQRSELCVCDPRRRDRVSISVPAVSWLLVSCAVGLGISYTARRPRALLPPAVVAPPKPFSTFSPCSATGYVLSMNRGGSFGSSSLRRRTRSSAC